MILTNHSGYFVRLEMQWLCDIIIIIMGCVAQLAGALEYTDCISAEGNTPQRVTVLYG